MWKAIFGKAADGIEKSVAQDDECGFILLHVSLPHSLFISCQHPTCCLLPGLFPCGFYVSESIHTNTSVVMIIDNDPSITKFISISRDMSTLSCSALTAGIVEAILDGLGFVSSIFLCS
jgi:hypothetical protein